MDLGAASVRQVGPVGGRMQQERAVRAEAARSAARPWGRLPRAGRAPARTALRGRARAARAAAGPSRLRRVLAGVAPVVCAAAVVVGAGVLADLASAGLVGSLGPSRPAMPVVSVEATMRPGETVRDVARRVVPEQSVADVDAVVARIVVANGVPAELLQPGRVVRVPLG